MIRSILAVLAGFVTWFVVATLGNFLIRALLPGLCGRRARPWTFTLAMMVSRLGLAVVSSLVAGYVCSLVARGKLGAVPTLVPRYCCCASCPCTTTFGTSCRCGITSFSWPPWRRLSCWGRRYNGEDGGSRRCARRLRRLARREPGLAVFSPRQRHGHAGGETRPLDCWPVTPTGLEVTHADSWKMPLRQSVVLPRLGA